MFKRIWKSELGRGALILFITINLFSLLNFVFHFFMGRLLGPADYGVLVVLTSFIYIFSIPSEAIQNIIVRYTARMNLEKENGKIKYLLVHGLKKALNISVLLFIIAIPLSFFLSKILQINIWLILITNILIFSSFSLPIVRGVLQGRKQFGLFGTSLVAEGIVKLGAAILFVYIGMGVFGALYGIVLGAFGGFLLSTGFNYNIIKEKTVNENFKNFKLQSIPYFLAMLVIFLVFSLDILFAKLFFNPIQVGEYAAVSMLGKIIFFGSSAIGKAMFPLTSERYEKGKNSFILFKKSFLIVSIICCFVILVYILFPKSVILTLYGSQYLNISNLLFYSGISLGFLSLTSLTLTYSLSTDSLKKAHFLFVFVLLEILLFSLFHKSLLEYTLAFMFSNIIMFIGSLFLVKYSKNEFKSNDYNTSI